MQRLLFSLCVLLGLPVFCWGSSEDSAWFVSHYTKEETYITMRDGIRLYTIIYAPKDHSKPHPILINRTPYSIAPYGAGYKSYWNTPYMEYIYANYILVIQDVRGKFMSEGEFMDVRPYIPAKKGKQTDEASDTYDTIEWLLKHVKNNNKCVGIYGISYPGYYAMMGALCQHPALKAASPQAPVTDWFAGDDFHHNGAFMLMDAFNFYTIFGRPRPAPIQKWGPGYQYPTPDYYQFFMEHGTMADIASLMGDSIAFWHDLYQHPDYDAWWQARNTRNYAQYIPKNCATLVVGGLFDAEDCFGAWNLYKAIEKRADNNNKLVMGPWSHGGWSRGKGDYLGNVRFAGEHSVSYHKNIEFPFFEYYLNHKGSVEHIAEANIFFSGSNQWKKMNSWAPANATKTHFYFTRQNTLDTAKETTPLDGSHYVSDPNKPVPYAENMLTKRTNEYMTDDQRFAARRPDVLVYESGVLKKDITIGGEVTADIYVMLEGGSDVDVVVKLIDVFPDNFSYDTGTYGMGNGKNYPMGGYQMLVRGEVMRAKYRNSLSYPEKMKPGEVYQVKFKLPDVAHTFLKNHKIMVQVQSSWFPLVDRNPQQFLNIYQCPKSDFVPCKVHIMNCATYPSSVILPVLK
ncbi:MAG: CocE/NonD family hydrolase [Chitinophagia bacterium]|nr:CocE/NonD family hydrolase [Chitinophagia bacterium]